MSPYRQSQILVLMGRVCLARRVTKEGRGTRVVREGLAKPLT